jgi:hypothetical protein
MVLIRSLFFSSLLLLLLLRSTFMISFACCFGLLGYGKPYGVWPLGSGHDFFYYFSGGRGHGIFF